ncbi:MAG: SUMF1/EgtB/PvdO family nonheme iron enzyme [Myxococcales bacterium]|nr:SUMF1/EgtB/PvdO family nonheme iron enzyme [Myxococcales bacterium]
MRLRLLASAIGLVVFAACNGASQANPPAAKTEQGKPLVQPRRAKPRPKPVAKKTLPTPVETAPTASGAPDAAAPKAAAPADMLPVPAGTFQMGSDDEGEQDEHPAHAVTLKEFFLDTYEVTNGQYLECVNAKLCQPWKADAAKAMKYGSEREFRGAKKPVVGVSWNDAKTYCEWRNKRLPTEAEWERAARGDDGRKYPWGNAFPDPKKHGCFQGCQGGATAEVGSFPDDKGPYGHHDLAGNVWEWSADHYDPYAYKRATAAQGVPGSCEEITAAQDELRKKKLEGYTGSNPIPVECERVLRGGAFNYHAKGLRSSNRVHHPGTWRLLVAGFRCAKDAS